MKADLNATGAFHRLHELLISEGHIDLTRELGGNALSAVLRAEVDPPTIVRTYIDRVSWGTGESIDEIRLVLADGELSGSLRKTATQGELLPSRDIEGILPEMLEEFAKWPSEREPD